MGWVGGAPFCDLRIVYKAYGLSISYITVRQFKQSKYVQFTCMEVVC